MCDMTFRFFAALSALLPTIVLSCEKVDTKGRTPGATISITPEPDTVLLFTAVRVPEDYDWHRDTAAGASSCELLLYKDMELAAVYHTGPQFLISTDPDTHHLIGGHLYTEYVTDAETVVGRDGEELFRYAGRELLLGILPFGSSVYTVGRRRSGDICTFRKNGELLLQMEDCRIFGDFGSSAYGRTGALYRDGDHFCFCYQDLSGKCWKVVDGQKSKVSVPSSAGRTVDVKIHDGKEYIMYEATLGSNIKTPSRTYSLGPVGWSSGGIVFCDGALFAAGNRYNKTNGIMAVEEGAAYVNPSVEGIFFGAPAFFIYGLKSEAWAVIAEGDGFTVQEGEDVLYGIPSAYIFTRDCAQATEGGFLIGVTPRAKGAKPYLLFEDEEYVVNINGYITSVAMEIKR